MKWTHTNLNDIGLSFFYLIKKIKGEQVDLSSLTETNSQPISHEIWDRLLKANVSEDGMADYEGFMAQKEELQTYLDLLSANPHSAQWPVEECLAYWINAYNAFTVKLILDHYPLESIKDIAGNIPMVNSPWDLKFFQIGGIDFDLNTIEHEILRKQFDEPRIHFAINCASFSCPKLKGEAYVGSKIEAQLEAQAIDFINDPSRNRITAAHLELSKIFDWFKSDFTKTQSLLEYLRQYSKTSFPENAKVTYLDYNWQLNAVNVQSLSAE